MVVLIMKMMKNKTFFLLLSFGVFFSCTKDRIIEVEPSVIPTEYWKKDSLVYTLYQGEAVLNQQITPFGVSSPDTLTLYYESSEFSLTFIEENKDSIFLNSEIGLFSFTLDSLFLLGLTDTIKQKVVLKADSVMILENKLINGNYVRQYLEYYHLLDINKEVPLISFKDDIYNPIFYNNGEGKCMPCHNSDGGQIRLAPAQLAYDNLITGISENDGGVDFIKTLQPEESYLYRLIINNNVEYAMPPNNALSPFEAQTILTWISQGARDN